MQHALATISIPFDEARSDAVEATLDRMGNPSNEKLRNALNTREICHFISITVARGDAGSPAHLVIELNVDGSSRAALDYLTAAIGIELRELLAAAELRLRKVKLREFLGRHLVEVGQGWLSTPGLNFDGTPGMSVTRIRKEADLASRIAQLLDTAPPANSPLQTLQHIKTIIWADDAMKWAFVPEAAPCLQTASGIGWRTALRLLASVTGALIWPFALIAAIVFVATWAWGSFGSAIWLGLLAFALMAGAIYAALRRAEKSHIPVDLPPDTRLVAEIMRRESFAAQNHLAAVSILKPGRLRRFLLRVGFWVAAQIATHFSRPSFLGKTGVIHFARWVLLPGTNKLVFFSNYDGAWETYLEDFIERAHHGVTGIWSNTEGFPRTHKLFLAGATDGDRLKRWTRRQQRPTRFWYTAYPDLTLERIRTNAAIRQGIASARTEADAADWLACFGSAPQRPGVLESAGITTLIFGGLPRLRFAQCLVLRLSSDVTACKKWLAQIAPLISYGETRSAHTALVAAFSSRGLRKLGLKERDLATFPGPFQDGMNAEWRAHALGDTGQHAPQRWLWGSGEREADVILLFYGDDADRLAENVRAQDAEIGKWGHQVVQAIPLAPLPERGEAIREPFGFVDGVSQPIVHGTRRWKTAGDSLHLVQPGEFVLGYPDNRGYLPPSPSVAASDDPTNLLPPAGADPFRQRPDFSRGQPNAEHDIGRDGTFLVVRHLEQHLERFDDFLDHAATSVAGDHRAPGLPHDKMKEWIAAKMVGRWKDGGSLVRYPHAPGSNRGREVRPDNDFLFGAEDPSGLRCPFGAHIRRTNPRDSLTPGSPEQLAISNRHRILRIGRSYVPANGAEKPGLLFMCLNADIERQFEFIQQSWMLGSRFHGLENEIDPTIGGGRSSEVYSIPTEAGPLRLKALPEFATVRGGGYFFLPGKRAMDFLST